MSSASFSSHTEQDTDRLGAALASVLPSQVTIALCGTLGAGKTRLVQAIAAAIGVRRDEVTSPTFVICQHYEGEHVIHHLDAYRVKDQDEWFELGVDELFDRPGWTFVEWADRFESCLPDSYLRIDIELADERDRVFQITAQGEDLVPIVERLNTVLQLPAQAPIVARNRATE